MANRQYVGARYVPKFYQGSNGNEWDSNVVYEALTMVTYLGSTYCSKKPVPARTVAPNLDTEYWVLTAAYSSQVAELREEVDGIENDITDNIKPDILANTTNIGLNTSAIKSLAGLIDFSERKFLFVGDSYATTTPNWVDVCATTCGITNYENLGTSGSAFFDNKFINQITNYTGNRNEVTDIVVGGGLNDARFASGNADYNTCKQAIIDFANYAKTNYPNATLWLAFIGNALDDAPLLSGRTYEKRIWAKWCYELVGRQYGFNIIKGCDEALATNTANFSSDHLHPASGGTYSIAYCLANALSIGEPINIYPEMNVTLTGIGNNEIVSGTSLKYACDNGVVDITVSEPFAVSIGQDNPSFSSSSKIELVTMNELYFNKRCVIPVMGRIDNYNNKTFQNVPMVLIFEGNKICMQCDQINSSNSGFETFTTALNGAQVCVQRGISFTLPMYYIN